MGRGRRRDLSRPAAEGVDRRGRRRTIAAMPLLAKLRSQRALLAALALLGAAPLPAQGQARVLYTIDAKGVSLADAEMTLQVTMRIDAPPGERTVFEVPVWTPGSYRLRDFPERVTPTGARAGDRA